MTLATPEVTKTSHREQVKLLLSGLRLRLVQSSTRFIEDTPAKIVAMVIEDTEGLHLDMEEDLRRQLHMAVNAPCWSTFGMTCTTTDYDKCVVRVSLIV